MEVIPKEQFIEKRLVALVDALYVGICGETSGGYKIEVEKMEAYGKELLERLDELYDVYKIPRRKTAVQREIADYPDRVFCAGCMQHVSANEHECPGFVLDENNQPKIKP